VKILLAVVCAAAYSLANDIDSVFARSKEIYRSEISRDSVENLVSAQHEDGSWDSPNYGTKGHMPIEHLENVRSLAYGFDQRCSKENSESDSCGKVKQAVIKALVFWFDHQEDFASDNWWMNEIGMQRELSPISFLMWREIPQPLRQKIIECYPKEPSGNGTNRAWISENVLVRGILERNENLIHLGVKNLESTMLMTKQEGHQVDHSFFMHGNQLYNGCYGKSALSLAARWAFVTRGLSYAFSQKSIKDMSSLALDGNRMMMWKGMADAMTVGREISLKDGNRETSEYSSIIEYLRAVDPSRSKEYDSWREEIAGAEHFSGCRYFWRGEMMVCKSKDHYVSLKMSSSRTVGGEFLNRQNRKGLWLGSGVLSVYKHPDDYKNIYPLWNWSMLPGVTSYDESDLKEKRVTNKSDFVGGISEGQFGAATMILNRPKLSAKNCWIFLENKVVALGTEISSSHPSAVKTTLDQRLVHSAVFAGKDTLGLQPIASSYVWHDSVGYKILDKQLMRAVVEKKNGNWNSIGTQKIEESGDVVSLWIDHGVNPKKSSYTYVVSVGVGNGFYKEKDSFVVAQNDGDAQIVLDLEHKVLTGVVYKKKRVNVGQIGLSFDEPTIFLLGKKKTSCFLKTLKLPNEDLEAAKETKISCPMGF